MYLLPIYYLIKNYILYTNNLIYNRFCLILILNNNLNTGITTGIYLHILNKFTVLK